MESTQANTHKIALTQHGKQSENYAVRDTLYEILELDRLGLLADLINLQGTAEATDTSAISDGLMAVLSPPGQESVLDLVSIRNIRIEDDMASNNPFNFSRS